MHILKRQLFPFKKFQILSSNTSAAPHLHPGTADQLDGVFAHNFYRVTQTYYNETSQGRNTKQFFEKLLSDPIQVTNKC